MNEVSNIYLCLKLDAYLIRAPEMGMVHHANKNENVSKFRTTHTTLVLGMMGNDRCLPVLQSHFHSLFRN